MDSRCCRRSRHYRRFGHRGCLNRFSVGRLISKVGSLLIRRFLQVRGSCENGDSCSPWGFGACWVQQRSPLPEPHYRRLQRNHVHLNRPPEQPEPAGLLGTQVQADQPVPAGQPGQPAEVPPRGALRNRGNLPCTQGRIHACRLGGVCTGQRLTVATPRILTAAQTISQWRRLRGLRGVC